MLLYVVVLYVQKMQHKTGYLHEVLILCEDSYLIKFMLAGVVLMVGFIVTTDV